MKDKSDKYLKDILKDLTVESPSGSFTDKVIQKISYEKKPVLQEKRSLFKRYKFMIIFLVTFTTIFIVAYIFPESEPGYIAEKLKADKINYSFIEKVKDFFTIHINIPVSYVIIIIASVLLFFIDTLIPKLKSKHLHN